MTNVRKVSIRLTDEQIDYLKDLYNVDTIQKAINQMIVNTNK